MLGRLIQWLAVACVFAVTALPWNPRRYLVPSDFMNLPKSRIRKDWLTHLLGALTIAFPLFYTSSSCAALITVSAEGDGVFASEYQVGGALSWRPGAKFSFTYDDQIVAAESHTNAEVTGYFYKSFALSFNAFFESRSYVSGPILLTTCDDCSSAIFFDAVTASEDGFNLSATGTNLATFLFSSNSFGSTSRNFFSGDLRTIAWNEVVGSSDATFSDSRGSDGLYVLVTSISVHRQLASVPNPPTIALSLIGLLGLAVCRRKSSYHESQHKINKGV